MLRSSYVLWPNSKYSSEKYFHTAIGSTSTKSYDDDNNVKTPVSFRIGGVTILRKGKSDLISNGETGESNFFSMFYFGYKTLRTPCVIMSIFLQ